MFVNIPSITIYGLTPLKVNVEVDVSNSGNPKYTIVGLPSKSVEESLQRVLTAIKNTIGYIPIKKIVVNLAPADIYKQGSYYDLPIAIGILAHFYNFDIPQDAIYLGELSLNGEVKFVNGTFLASLFAKENKIPKLIIPQESAIEASGVPDITILPIQHLRDIISFLKGETILKPFNAPSSLPTQQSQKTTIDDIIGQPLAKRGILISAAGGHNIILSGSPGSGKTMLAHSLQTLLPPLTTKESIEVTKIYSATGNLPKNSGLIKIRPFRSPHHSTSTAGIIGGGSIPKPGEITLAHRGILFFDELPEFPRITLESLRQPLEDKVITISRSRSKFIFPAQFIFVGAMNPCPCGYYGHPANKCTCTPSEITRYLKKISGPLLDRIDLKITVNHINQDIYTKLLKKRNKEHQVFKQQILEAREIQQKRFKSQNILTNAEMNNKDIKKLCKLDSSAQKLLDSVATQQSLSVRSIIKIIKVSQTIADLEKSKTITKNHIYHAFQFRNF